MIREVVHFMRHGPAVSRRQAAMSRVEFLRWMARELDRDGLARLRAELVDGLRGDVLEVGTGTGAMFPAYGVDVRVAAIEPDDEFRVAAEEAARAARATIRVLPGTAESLPFGDSSLDAIVTSTVLCSVRSVAETLAEFRRVLKPQGQLRLLEHVRSERWPAGFLMDLLNPIWLRVNKMGCRWNRRTVDAVRNAGFDIASAREYSVESPAAPALVPGRLIKARKSVPARQ
jgi:ubiquinone/menaquinone biosynthesis C-methylase UbiE